ncbi:MAG TPA: MFS transporter [Bryobacteraceae bacterium]|nr:MFS transporter [Bryobacteraceae bacterium]
MRWIVLGASLVIQTCLGAVYAWSAFVPALKRDHGLTGGQAGLVFGVTIAVFTVAMVFAGRMQESRGPRPVASVGAALFGAGYLLASFSGGSFPILLASLGVLAGAGTGFGYVCPLTTSVRWFPRHKGLIAGVAVAGFGGGAVLLSGVAGSLLARGVPVLDLFRLVGLVYGAATLAGALLLRTPEPPGAAAQPLLPFRVLTASREFRSLAIGMFAGTFGGLLVVGNLGPMGLAAGLPSDMAILSIQVFALGNAAGRVGWGWLHDRVGRPALPISLLALLSAIVALAAAESAAAFVGMAGVTGFCFGACFVLYAAQVSAAFGYTRLGGIYPFIFLAYGFSGLTGPAFGGWIHDLTGGFTLAVVAAAAILALGAAAVHQAGRRRPGDALAPTLPPERPESAAVRERAHPVISSRAERASVREGIP